MQLNRFFAPFAHSASMAYLPGQAIGLFLSCHSNNILTHNFCGLVLSIKALDVLILYTHKQLFTLIAQHKILRVYNGLWIIIWTKRVCTKWMNKWNSVQWMNRFNAISLDQVFMFKMIEKPQLAFHLIWWKTALKDVDRRKILVILIFLWVVPSFSQISSHIS